MIRPRYAASALIGLSGAVFAIYAAVTRPAAFEPRVMGADDQPRASASAADRVSARYLEQNARTAAELAELKDKLAALELKLSLLNTSPAQNTRAGVTPGVEPRPKSTEPDMGAWMIETIRGQEWDRQRTEQVEDELASALVRTPNLNLDNVECGTRFCSGTLSSNDGKPAALASLWGVPPLDGEGFTNIADDGKVALFFAKPGESMDTLRQEASAHAR